MNKSLTLVAVLLTVLTAASVASATENKTLCVFDPSGAHGDIFKFAKSYQTAALGWGVRFKLKAQTNEVVATSDFKAKKCDAVLLTSLRARKFVRTTGSIEAIGALPSYSMLKTVIRVLASPKAAKLVTTKKGFETVGILPGGAVYLLLRDRRANSMAKLSGKRIATLIHDKPARVMVDVVGASMVPAEVGTFAGIFNNGRADACYAPATAVKPLELTKGMKRGGGIVKFPIAQLTFQVITRTASMPAGFGQQSRKWVASQFKAGLAMAKKAERAIPGRYWISANASETMGYHAKFAEVRERLRKKGVYSSTMLKLMNRIRCRKDKSLPGC
ncbi:MAG TPA: hypothetical protein DCQ06_09440 [Myxococcales bacterium]|nr:hypothetical protein [Myxococcales bacterium]HAN31806.1 hypothetical protein [Myxococcales bacterium]